jgi:hypothetical protein
MNITLLIPALFPAFDPGPIATLPALERILARAQWAPLPPQAVVEDWIATPARNRAPAPVQEAGHWWYATPAHVRLEGTRALFMDAGQLEITTGETEALLADLNRHFAAEGLHFEAPAPQEWLVQSTQPIALETSWPPLWCAGRDALHWLPTGPDQSRWRGYFNEIQMLFFEHPVNQQRMAQGLPTLDALWFWNREQLAAQPPQLLDALRRPAAYEAVEHWHQGLQEIEQALAPQLEQLQKGTLESLTLLCPEGRLNNAITLKRSSLRWHFWKPNRPLTHYHAHHQPQNR